MSYLSDTLGFSDQAKVTISLWFRVPKTSINAAAQEFEAAWNSDPSSPYQYGFGWSAGLSLGVLTYDAQPPQMAGIIPLLTFGKTGSESNLSYETKHFGSWVVTNYFWNGSDWVIGSQTTNHTNDQVYAVPPTTTWSTEPSYIGVWCTANPPRALLAVNLETRKRASIVGVIQSLIGHTVEDREFYNGPTPFPPHHWGQVFTYGDSDPNPLFPRTECFRVHPLVSDIGQYDGTTGLSPPFGTTVTPDQWHHLLLSFDMTTPCKTHGVQFSTTDELAAIRNQPNPSPFVDSAPKLWIAYDDVNKGGRDLSYYWRGKGATGSVYNPPQPDKPDAANADPNEILSRAGWLVASTATGVDGTTTTYDAGTNETYVETHTGLIQAQYDSRTAAIPMQGLMGLPASADLVDHVRHIEMAEFQMWIGVAIDTSVEANRRAFIDYKRDGKGVPIPDKDGKLTLIPVDPAKAAKLVGRKPDVELHKSSNWIKGANTGSTGVGPDGKPISAGQFKPTGVIKKYKPDPSIVVT